MHVFPNPVTNSYACSVPPLANVKWSCFSRVLFAYHVAKSMTGEMAPMEGSNFSVGPYIHWLNINEFHKKSSKTIKISHYLLTRLVVQKLIDN